MIHPPAQDRRFHPVVRMQLHARLHAPAVAGPSGIARPCRGGTPALQVTAQVGEGRGAQPGVVQVQQRDAGAEGGGQALGQLKLLQGASREVLHRHQQPLPLAGFAHQPGHHHRAGHLPAGGLHQIPEQPASQAAGGGQAHQHQVAALLHRHPGDARRHVGIHPQQGLAGNGLLGADPPGLLQQLPPLAQLGRDGRGAGLGLVGGDHGQGQHPAGVVGIAADQQPGQVQQRPLVLRIGHGQQHGERAPHQGQAAAAHRLATAGPGPPQPGHGQGCE